MNKSKCTSRATYIASSLCISLVACVSDSTNEADYESDAVIEQAPDCGVMTINVLANPNINFTSNPSKSKLMLTPVDSYGDHVGADKYCKRVGSVAAKKHSFTCKLSFLSSSVTGVPLSCDSIERLKVQISIEGSDGNYPCTQNRIIQKQTKQPLDLLCVLPK